MALGYTPSDGIGASSLASSELGFDEEPLLLREGLTDVAEEDFPSTEAASSEG